MAVVRIAHASSVPATAVGASVRLVRLRSDVDKPRSVITSVYGSMRTLPRAAGINSVLVLAAIGEEGRDDRSGHGAIEERSAERGRGHQEDSREHP